jgi:uncharacterized FAD-dependent dehydrogenase
MMSTIGHYHPFIAAFTVTLGLGIFGGIAYAQNGGFVSDVSKTSRMGTTILEEQVLQEVPFSKVEQLPLELDEVVIVVPKHTPKMHKLMHEKRLLQCKQRELEQGVREETPTVKMCEWITLP